MLSFSPLLELSGDFVQMCDCGNSGGSDNTVVVIVSVLVTLLALGIAILLVLILGCVYVYFKRLAIFKSDYVSSGESGSEDEGSCSE